MHDFWIVSVLVHRCPRVAGIRISNSAYLFIIKIMDMMLLSIVMPPIVKTRIFENKYFPFLTYFNPPL
jgi:hypothetical protein